MTATLTPHLHELELTTTFSVARGLNARTSYQLSSEGLCWNDQFIAFDAITSVAYRARRIRRNLVQRHTARSVWLGLPGTTAHIALGHERFGPDHSADHHQFYGSLVESLHTHVEPRLRDQLIRQLAAGENVWIGPLRLDRHGIHHGAKARTLHWSQLPVAQVEGSEVSIRAVIEAQRPHVESAPMEAANAVLLPELVTEASLLFC